MTRPHTLLLVDDDALVRTGLSLILGGHDDLSVLGEAEDGVAGVRMARELRPDLVLMDIRMPRCDGIEATRILAAEPHPPAVLVLTTFDADDLVMAALRAGAAGFLLKDTPPAQMVAAIRSVVSGEPVLSPAVVRHVISAVTTGDGDERRRRALGDLGVLTEREREVAVSVALGRSNAEIARELYMSVATVKAHVSSILDKLSATNRVQVAMRVHDAGWV